MAQIATWVKSHQQNHSNYHSIPHSEPEYVDEHEDSVYHDEPTPPTQISVFEYGIFMFLGIAM
jgi:hypothetical protein